MTLYQIYTRIKHFFTAKHWRGAAIHSPTMYSFVREFALKNRGRELILAIGAPVVERVDDLQIENAGEIIILREPFRNREEKRKFEQWFEENHAVTAHFQGLIVIFFDKKLQKQKFVIRN